MKRNSDAIEEIKSRINIVDLVSRTVDLKKAGTNYKGLCQSISRDCSIIWVLIMILLNGLRAFFPIISSKFCSFCFLAVAIKPE